MSNTPAMSGTTPLDEPAKSVGKRSASPPEAWHDETWHQSSWDLRTGLMVLEDADVTIPAELLED